MEALQSKLQNLSGGLGNWERCHFGNIRQEINSLKKQLTVLREIQGRSGPSHAEVKVTDRLVELYHREEILWRQRARLD